METLNQTVWDVVLAGTGISQSLLALALSRSGKKVLHIDRNDYYGSAEAALSLQEVEAWVESITSASQHLPFKNAVLLRNPESGSQLGFSRAYSISLSPQLIYSRSNLLPALISSKVYRQLEFLAVGSWWEYEGSDHDSGSYDGTANTLESENRSPRLRKIPGGREDVFGDTSLDLRSTRALMNFLKLAADTEAHPAILAEWGRKPFPEFLTAYVKAPPTLQPPLLALTLSMNLPSQTTTAYALPQIYRHLTSIGMFGPGFGSLIPRWGGLAEVAQVACRALAVGGGVYILKKGVDSIEIEDPGKPNDESANTNDHARLLLVGLEGGEKVKARWFVGNQYDLPSKHRLAAHHKSIQMSHSISIVSSPLSFLFPLISEGSPLPAGAFVVLPTGTLGGEEQPPVYLMVHSSDTGECPVGQCVIYASIGHTSSSESSEILNAAIENFLLAIPENPKPKVLWSLYYAQEHAIPASSDENEPANPAASLVESHIIQLPDIPPGVALEDDLLRNVRAAWEQITGGRGEGFMQFGDREGVGNEGEEEDEM